MNVDQCSGTDYDAIETLAVVFQRDFVLTPAFQIIPCNRVELRLGKGCEIEHVGAVGNSRVGLFGLRPLLRFKVTRRTEQRGQL